MSTVTISVPQEYGYVLTTLLLTGVLGFYQGNVVGLARRAAAIPYPNAYATHAEAQESLLAYRFNCAQRAHANYLENVTQTVVAAAIAGVQYPLITTGLMGAWLLGRLVYLKGYIAGSKEDKGKGRYKGIWYMLAQFGLVGVAGWSVIQMLRA